MYKLRSRRLRDRLVPLLSFVLLLQGLFPLQLHTVLASDNDGHLVQVCTLHGFDVVNLDPDLPEKNSAGQSLSAAMAFSSIMGSAISGIAMPVLHLAKQASYDIVLQAESGLSVVTTRHLSIRAPPIV